MLRWQLRPQRVWIHRLSAVSPSLAKLPAALGEFINHNVSFCLFDNGSEKHVAHSVEQIVRWHFEIEVVDERIDAQPKLVKSAKQILHSYMSGAQSL